MTTGIYLYETELSCNKRNISISDHMKLIVSKENFNLKQHNLEEHLSLLSWFVQFNNK